MSKLSAFMSANALKIENEKFVVSKRFTDKDGNPMEWELRGINSAEDEQIRKSSTKRIPQKGRTASTEVDYNLYLSKLTTSCVVFPDLHDAELQNSYGVMGAEDLLKVMLTPGENAALIKAIQKLNGFDNAMEDLVEEAKN